MGFWPYVLAYIFFISVMGLGLGVMLTIIGLGGGPENFLLLGPISIIICGSIVLLGCYSGKSRWKGIK